DDFVHGAEDFAGGGQDFPEMLTRPLSVGQVAAGEFAQQGDLRQARAEVIMHFVRDSSPLLFQCVLFFQALDFSDDTQSDPMQTVADEDDQETAQRIKRPRLIKMLCQKELEGSPLIVPYPVIVAAYDAE